MQLTLRLSPALIHEAEEQLEYVLKGHTIGECLQKVKDTIPELKTKLWRDERLSPQIILFHNNVLIKETGFSNRVNDKDVLDIIPAIEGG